MKKNLLNLPLSASTVLMFGFTMLLFASAAVAAGMGATIGAALDALLDGLRYLLAACAAPMAAWGFYCHWRGQPRYPLTGVFFFDGAGRLVGADAHLGATSHHSLIL